MVREGMHDDDRRPPGDGFPWLVAAASLAVGLWVFVTNTVDACSERAALLEAQERITTQRARLLEMVKDKRRRRAELPDSQDLLIIEMDRQGKLPHELVGDEEGGNPR